jgi:hypothetical protein
MYGSGENKAGVANLHKTKERYNASIGKATNEIFAQFLIRIYCEISTCLIANFSTLKNLQSSNFTDFRKIFRAKLEKSFLVPADSFDNVKGQFPIGFFIWNTSKKELFEQIKADIFNRNGILAGQKNIFNYDNTKGLIGKWLIGFQDKKNMPIGMINSGRNDFQNQNLVFIQNEISAASHALTVNITSKNLIIVSTYFAVRKCIEADWLNDRDQFLYPNEGWQTDEEFQNDCLVYTLFNNNIQSKYGVNHWIPFTEYEVAARDKFDSNFMTDFIEGKTALDNIVAEPLLFYGKDYGSGGYAYQKKTKREFSKTANNVFKVGRELWKYYHAQPKCNVNASLYDIREYFQGRDDKGKMNNKSNDETYNELIGNLRSVLKTLAKKIEPKVYEYVFLRR